MKILQVQKFNHLLGGGSRYYFELMKLLQKHGHRISQFCIEHPKNRYSPYQKYFVSNVTYDKNDFINRLKLFGRILYSWEAQKKIKQLLMEVQPDIVHIHDIHHHISPSILPIIKSFGIPIVQHLGDYHLISPNYHMFHDGKICEITKPKRFYRAFLHRCVKNSYGASLAEVTEKYLHNLLGWERTHIDQFIVPSLFMKNKLTQYGVDTNKIMHLPHFVNASSYSPGRSIGKYVLYFGRLSPEKGLDVLLQAMSKLPHIPLVIAGRGPQESALKEMAKRLCLRNVTLVGFLDGVLLKRLIEECKFTVLPSLWYEVFGLSILESFACGKPVVAAKIGGIPEVIEHNRTGLLFPPGDVKLLVRTIKNLWADNKSVLTMGKEALYTAETKYNPSHHYKRILALYHRALKK